MGATSQWARRFGAIGAVVAVTAVLLTACSGSALHADFRAAFAEDDAVGGFELSTADNMPFTDGLSAEVRARDGASADELVALVGRLSEFAREHDADDVRITVEAADLTVPVFADAEISTGAMARGLDLVDDDRVDSVVLSARTEAKVVTAVSIRLSDAGSPVAAFDLARTVPVLLDDVTGGANLHLTIAAEDRVRIDGNAGVWVDGVEQVWHAVSNEVPVTGLRAEPGRLKLTLATEADLAAAQALSAATAVALVVVFASPLVLLGADASGDSARTLLGAVAPADVSGVRNVWTDDDRTEFFVDSVAQATTTAAALSARPESVAFTTLTVTVGDPDEPSLSVSAAPSRLGDIVASAGDLLADGDVTSLVSTPRGTTLVLAGDATEAELESRLSALSGLADEGSRLCVNRPDGTGVCAAAP
ncbi:hypothetical protein KZC51_13030 [Microbacterium sp. SSW1-49]|uniref:Uncharacterized protein n=1 Tax=Microbacterium croceum TaxID=2851645 RepID=A0ABT0FG67_9MICO|nr:hypothetical protein [Microbacterium croceum]MCK2037056.1 hypothetical protein [Microbacterium croceum]